MMKQRMALSKQKALFLDRDGVIINDSGYTKDPNFVYLISGIDHLLKTAHELGYLIFVVTNQSGIGRKKIELHEYQKVTQKMLDLLNEKNALYVKTICYAPYYEGALTPTLNSEHFTLIDNSFSIPNIGIWDPLWRKPQLGMLQYLISQFHIDPLSSYIVGDRWTDQLLAIQYPLKGGFWYCENLPYFQECSEFLQKEDFKHQKLIYIVKDLFHVADYLS